MRAAAAVLLLAVPALAGCLTAPDLRGPGEGTPGAASLLCHGVVCNFVATVDPPERQGNEVSLAVNPLDGRNIIATAKDYNPSTAGDCTYAALYVTKDGGATWKNVNLPGSPWKRLQDPTEPLTTFSKFWCVTDPVVDFGPDGTAYWTVMPYQCDAVSGSKFGRELVPGSGIGLPMGGMNDWFWTCSAMYVLVSDDGGETWPMDKVREVAFGPRLEHDKQWIAASPDGVTVLLCWDRGPATAPAAYAGAPVPSYAVVCSVSRDKGDTWSEMTDATNEGWVPWVDYGPEGRAWMVVANGFLEGDVLVASSDDGLQWSGFTKVASFVNADGSNEYGWPTLRNSAFRIVPTPTLAIDRSDGPWSGSLYVTYFDHRDGQGDVYLVRSRDGVTWSDPVRVHDDGESPNDQFYPVVSVGPDGTVDVSWWDRRDDPDNYLFHVYHTYSLDGGETFAPNVRVTDVASDEVHSRHQNGMVFLGDYRDSASGDGFVHLVWVDTRNGKADVMVGTVQRPGANPIAS